MTDRHLPTRHVVVLHGELLLATVPLGTDIAAAVAAEATRAKIDVDISDIDVHQVYLSDVRYDDLIEIFRSGPDTGQIAIADGEFAYAYDADDADQDAKAFVEAKGKEVSRLLRNLAYDTQMSGNVGQILDAFQAGKLSTMDVLAIRRAFDVVSQIETFVSDYVLGADAQPVFGDVIDGLEEKGLLPSYDFWVDDPFVITVAALAAEAIDEADATEEEAEAALKARDPDLFILGRDPYRDHKLKVGREIEDGRAFVNVTWRDDYRAVIAWAEGDANFVEREAS